MALPVYSRLCLVSVPSPAIVLFLAQETARLFQRVLNHQFRSQQVNQWTPFLALSKLQLSEFTSVLSELNSSLNYHGPALGKHNEPYASPSFIGGDVKSPFLTDSRSPYMLGSPLGPGEGSRFPFGLREYEQKRLAGVNAMQSRMSVGEYRVPTNTWSGYGISHTSPAPLQIDASSTSSDVVMTPPSTTCIRICFV